MIQSKKQLYSFVWGAALLCILWATRIVLTHTLYFGFLFWNLLLAYIPFAFSRYMAARPKMSSLRWELCFVAWLLFLPNAPYLITDLVHLEPRPGAYIWLDACILFTAAISGLWIGCISLLQMESVWKNRFPRIHPRYFIAVVLVLCGFGIYLGRILRFNSWDVLTDPLSLLQVVAHRVAYPFRYLSTWFITFLFAGMMWVAFLQVKNLVKEA